MVLKVVILRLTVGLVSALPRNHFAEHFRQEAADKKANDAMEEALAAFQKGDFAAAHFVLGYHYLVLGHLEYAVEVFDRVAVLEPRDTVAVQLRNPIKDSIASDAEESEEQPVPAMVDPDKIVGTWTFDKGDKSGELAGEFGIAEENLLALSPEDSQLVGGITFPEDSKLSFTLAGGPRGDPGLTFERVP